MDQGSGLIHKRHRRGKRRRTKRRLAVRVTLSFVSLAAAWALSAGIIHIIERPVPPFKGMNHQQLADRSNFGAPDSHAIFDSASVSDEVNGKTPRSR